jgi:rhomboid protease GluP
MTMKHDAMVFKLRHLLLPVVLLSLAFTLVYSFLNWLLVARSGWISLDEDIVDLWLPGALAWTLVIVLVQPRLRVLKLRDRQGNLPILYHLAAVAVVAVPAIIAQGYVRTASGDLVHVEDADLIATSPSSKFYAADHVCMHLYRPVSKPFVTVSGRQNEHLSFDLYVMTPICSTRGAGSHDQRVWLGSHYHRSINNNLADAAKEETFNSFVRESLSAFNAEDPGMYRFLENLGHNLDRKRFEETLQAAYYNLAAPVILIAHTEAFEERTGSRLKWALIAFSCLSLVWLCLVMIPALDRSAKGREPKRTLPGASTLDSWWNMVLPRRAYYGSPILIDINVIVFIVMAMSGLGVVSFNRDDLLAWGANFRPLIHGIGVMRLVTSQFVHGGLMHLFGNLYGLLLAGLFLTPAVTNARLIACYLLCGLGGSIASVLAHPTTVSIGASGAIFGLFGILLTLLLLNDARFTRARMGILVNAGIFVGFNLLIGAGTPGIDNAAHLGGLAVGAALGVGMFLVRRFRAPGQKAGLGERGS